MGLMQIMPATWAGLRQRYRLGADPHDAHDNIVAGAAYLRELHDRYGVPGFLATYNAFPRDGKTTWQPAGHCRRRRRRTMPASLQSSAAVRRTTRFRSPPSSVMDQGILVCRTFDRVSDRRSTRIE